MAIQFSATDRQSLIELAQGSFPDTKAAGLGAEAIAVAGWMGGQTSVATPSGVVDLTPYEQQLAQEGAALGLTKRSPNQGGEVVAGATVAGVTPVRYYRVSATHDREIPDLMPFTGHLTMARVTLPASGRTDFDTAIGRVLVTDHFMVSNAEVASQFGAEVGPIARVDLITPTRLAGTRFGAISVYLGYRQGDVVPSFYVLEAGTAMGEPMTLYFVKQMGDAVNDYSGYTPTAFAAKTHVYTGRLSLDGDSPDTLRITAHKTATSTPYIKLNVKFEETSTAVPIWPGWHILEAATRVLERKILGVT